MREVEPKLPVLIMTAFGTTDTAIEATKLGAFDYVLKPFEIPDILHLIEQALEAGRFMRSRVEMDVVPAQASPEMDPVWLWFDGLLGATASTNPRNYCNF